jgi:hypothetical protein
VPEPATSVVISGLVSDGQALDAADAPVLRILVPSLPVVALREAVPEGLEGQEPQRPQDASLETPVRVSIYGTDGLVHLRGVEEITVTPGIVHDLPIGGLAPGGYTIVVDADVPLLAAAAYWRATTADPGAVVQGTLRDVAWVSGLPLPAAESSAQAAIPQGTSATLAIVALPEVRDGRTPTGRTASATVRLIGPDGAWLSTTDLTLPPGVAQQIPLGDPETGAFPAFVEVSAEDGVVAWGLELTAPDAGGQDRLVATIPGTWLVPAPTSVTVRDVDVP